MKQKYPGLMRELWGSTLESWKDLSLEEFVAKIRATEAISKSDLNKKNQKLYQAALRYKPQALRMVFGPPKK